MEEKIGTLPYSEEFQKFLSQFLTPERMEVMEKVMNDRTRHITVAIEDVYQSHNASAIIRTCDCFGIQDVHVIENRNKYKVNPKVASGSGHWVSVIKHSAHADNTEACMNHLKEKGYQIIATTPHTNDISLYDLNIEQPVALVFGNEKKGISDAVRKHADGFLRIPMYGFSESLNISVSAAICLSVVAEKLRTMNFDWHLSEEERRLIVHEWTKYRLGSIEKYEHEFLRLQEEK